MIGAWGRERGEELLSGYTASFAGDGKLLELGRDVGVIMIRAYNNATESYIFKR